MLSFIIVFCNISMFAWYMYSAPEIDLVQAAGIISSFRVVVLMRANTYLKSVRYTKSVGITDTGGMSPPQHISLHTNTQTHTNTPPRPHTGPLCILGETPGTSRIPTLLGDEFQIWEANKLTITSVQLGVRVWKRSLLGPTTPFVCLYLLFTEYNRNIWNISIC